ncbi:ABC transporter [Microbacterium oleivorans]|uniref:ABC transporter n=1 Tax=Microbacterium oleivorans TaxID=273677 RepID=A0A7D5IQD7_9MICO|nr:ABC transporter [Microbacterium oleivorans]QLD12179.1 ABC transporter [Microbacterium oleivorans]
MSDPKYGEPVEEPTPVDDVVGSARAGLADAEASRDAVTADDWDAAYGGTGTLPERATTADDADLRTDAGSGDATGASDGSHRDADPAGDRHGDAPAPAASDAWNTPSQWDAHPEADADASAAPAATPVATAATTAAPAVAASDTATRAYGADDEPARTGSVSASEPVGGTSAAAAPQPIFVQAPEAPTPRGNRGAAGAIGLLAAIVFALIYLGSWLAIGAVQGEVTATNVGEQALDAVTSWWLWVPVAVFFLAFWILGAFINRGRWGLWVLLGLLVGVASYAGHVLGQLFEAPFWNIPPSEALALVGEQAFVPLALVALVAGRELTIWFGAWVAARGRRVTELNAEAQREYERTLEAGPQLHRY